MDAGKLITFSECLKGLLDATGVNCRKLALILNFEYSTVYKWKGGQRIPPFKNHKEVIKQISEVFAQAAIEDEICSRRVWTMITKHHKEINDKTVNERNITISKQEIIQYINTILINAYNNSKDFVVSEKSSVNIAYEQDNGKEKISNGIMYFGITEVAKQYRFLIQKGIESNCGKYKSIIYFNLTNKIDFGIGETEDSYVENIKKLIDNGWRINMTFCIDKYKYNSMSISNIITSFSSIISKESFSMSYMYMDTTKRQIDSIFIIPGVGAIITYSLEDWNGNEFCYIINDQKPVDLIYKYYYKILENARPMYSFHNFEWYFKTNRYSYQSGEDNMIITNNIGFTMMHKEEIEYFVKDILSDRFDDKQDMINYINDTVKFYNTISGNAYKHIISKGEFLDYIRNGKNSIMGYKCIVDVDKRIKHLEHLLKLVEDNPNVELLLLDDIEFDSLKGLRLNINSGNNALINIINKDIHDDIENDYGFIVLTEPFVIKGLKSKFKRIWQNTSNNILIKRGSTDWLKLKINWLKDINTI